MIATSAGKFLDINNVEFSSDTEIVAEDMADAKIKYDISFPQYFQFHFEGKTDDYRRSYIGNKERRKYTSQLNSQPEILNNKWNTYTLFSDFYHRDICRLQNEDDYDNAIAFVRKHSTFIAKPISANKGRGVKLFDINDISQFSPSKLIADYQGG